MVSIPYAIANFRIQLCTSAALAFSSAHPFAQWRSVDEAAQGAVRAAQRAVVARVAAQGAVVARVAAAQGAVVASSTVAQVAQRVLVAAHRAVVGRVAKTRSLLVFLLWKRSC